MLMARKRALIVDDSKSARVILSRMLEKYDIEVDLAESAEQSIEYLKGNRPDAIFMDHLMPGMDGLQAVQAIKSNPQTATIPIMMYTSQEGDLYVGQARALGAMGVLPKQVRPVDVSKVLYELHLLPERRDNDEPPLRRSSSPRTPTRSSAFRRQPRSRPLRGLPRQAPIGAAASRRRSGNRVRNCAASSSRASTALRRASSSTFATCRLCRPPNPCRCRRSTPRPHASHPGLRASRPPPRRLPESPRSLSRFFGFRRATKSQDRRRRSRGSRRPIRNSGARAMT